MRYQTEEGFALRSGHRMGTLRGNARLALCCITLAMGAGLSSCAESPNYPSLSKITDLGTILSPEERQKAVQDMQKQEQTHSNDAAKAIARPDPQ